MTGTLASAARAAVLALALLFVSTLPALADPQFPALTGRVVDDAHVLPADTKAALTQKLADLETKTGDQLVVATVPTLQGGDIDSFAVALHRKWGLGQKGKNNGVLFLIAPKEHKARIEVGYGLEGTLTDIYTGAVLDERVFPRFKAGDMPGGITAGVDALVAQLSPEMAKEGATPAAPSGPPIVFRPQHRSHGLPLGAIIAMIIVFLVLSRVLRFGFWPLFLLGSLGGRGGGWGGGDGGWGGGGGGGFSGGGGSSGGGGASGSW